MHKDIAVLYHGGCPDGFGGAYAAWKKFGDSADYIPVQYGKPIPNHLEDNDVYFVDFCYPNEIMQPIIAMAKSVTVLDHHLGNRANVESMPNFVFDEKRSGATIAWSYFHPETPVPLLLEYVQDGDLYVFKLPDSHSMLAYMYAQPFDFEAWDHLRTDLENPTTRATLLDKGRIYSEHFNILIEQIAKKAVLIDFEGHECYLVTAASMFVSDVGNHLAKERPPLALVTNFHGDVLNVSLRSDASIDVSAIARKYGGNGHPQAAAFRLNWGDPLPWKVIENNANSSH
jgi:oligoribonuclease NrnB/cAMP/cGMP phosphodiesterase (DHH superfamily)